MAQRYSLPGRVHLTGAGPGSAKLLTLRALELLREADVVLHDDLVSAEVLAMIPARAAVHNVGKRCGVKKTTQEEINRRMIAAARSGQTVVRLKGGDPLIFGRTQEEISALREAGVEFEIVPGITAAAAAAAAAQIPLTDRQSASKVVFVSNHPSPEKGSRDWHRSIATDTTLVFYMPGRDLGTLTKELADSGLGEDTPCLVVSQATQTGQKLIRATVRGLTALPRLPAPSLLIVGTAVAEARADEWFFAGSGEDTEKSGEFEEITLDLAEPNELAPS